MSNDTVKGARLLRLCLPLAALLCMGSPCDAAGGSKPGITAGEFHGRRVRACALLDSASAAIFRAADVKWRNGDVNYPYRQESNYLYLTGVEEPSGFLVLVSGGVTVRGLTGRIIHLGGTNVRDSVVRHPDGDEMFVAKDRLREVLQAAAARIQTLYISAPDLRFVNDWLNDRPMFIERDARREFEKAHPGVKTRNASGLIGRLREIKSEAELKIIKHAIALTGEGIQYALKECKPGSHEYQLESAVAFGMRRGGADGVAFPSIIGSGPNSLIPHYESNNRRMQKGDVVVMDVGAEVNGYAADVSRTIPVSGRFTPEQRKIYDLVHAAHDSVINVIRPGVAKRTLDATARKVIADAGYGKYTLHGVTHQLGLDVHDVDVSDTLRAGMVITVEPGIYIPVNEESQPKSVRGVGVRLEDDVLVTGTGAEVLSRGIPLDPATIEKLMR